MQGDTLDAGCEADKKLISSLITGLIDNCVTLYCENLSKIVKNMEIPYTYHQYTANHQCFEKGM